MRRSGFKRKIGKPMKSTPLARVSKNKPKKSARAKKMELKRTIIEQYSLPMLPCSRYGLGKAPTRTDILKGMLWHIFSKFIRLRDKKLPCISCGTMCDELQAGHYAPVGGNDISLCFDEQNVNGECPTCNADFEGGGWHLVGMRKNLIAKYGLEVIETIDVRKSQKLAVKWDEQIYVDKIKYYYVQCEALSIM